MWQDATGSLTLWKAGEPTNRNYRLRLKNWSVVDLLPGKRLVVSAPRDASKAVHEHFLADQVVPRAIAHSGKLVLHAAAVRTGDEAILLLGASGLGKSTLSASFQSAGQWLIGDDAMIVSSDGDRSRVEAVYPSLRLFPDSIAATLQAGTSGGLIAEYSHKRRVDLADVPSPPMAIRSIFLLLPPDDRDAVSMHRLSAAEACMALVENSFALDPADVQRARSRLEQAAALAAEVPAYGLSYPRDYSRLDEVRALVLDQARGMKR